MLLKDFFLEFCEIYYLLFFADDKKYLIQQLEGRMHVAPYNALASAASSSEASGSEDRTPKAAPKRKETVRIFCGIFFSNHDHNSIAIVEPMSRESFSYRYH